MAAVFFNANSSHPFENPTPWSNFLEMFLILVIPTGLLFTFGEMCKDKKTRLCCFGIHAAAFCFDAGGLLCF